jgi:uncharacterized protein (TIGR03790 family)
MGKGLRKAVLGRWMILIVLSLAAHARCASAAGASEAGQALQAKHVAVIVNDDDANSVAIGAYYRQARNIPAENVVHVRIPNRPHRLTVEEFNVLKRQIESRLGPEIQIILLVWTAPYAVECNSITSALTLGFDAEQCKNTCAPGKPSPYFDSNTRRPYFDLNIRASMLLPTDSVERAKSLIERGVMSSFRSQPASAYFLATTDEQRSSRARFFPPPGKFPALQLQIKTLHENEISGEKDIMIYQTGLVSVPKLETLGFLPGALADHLTSSGGDLLGTRQMSSLRWLDAGATASYGTVSEPCNHWQKFPHPQVLLRHYLAGETAIEAYWKSVAWPAQGVVIGEPLAAPYRRR